VCHPCCQSADRFHLLDFTELLFEQIPFGHVPVDT
jgi:hypothetical protein